MNDYNINNLSKKYQWLIFLLSTLDDHIRREYLSVFYLFVTQNLFFAYKEYNMNVK